MATPGEPVKSAEASIAELVLTYAERIDDGDFEGVADLLADAQLTSPDDGRGQKGREEILQRYQQWTRRYDDGTPRTKHVTTNLIVDVDEDAGTATCRSYYTVFQAVPGVIALQPIIAGRYRDRFTRSGGAWKFTARHIIVDLVGDLSRHLLIELPPP
jgi:3-phenylpropionate/cinnamic acid dioxygenase small subunit